MNVFSKLSWRQKCTYCAHLFKALFRQHHTALLPILKKVIPANGIVIDIGGHAGQFTKLFSSLSPKGHIYTFEPGTYAYSILSKVHALKRLKNVSLFKMGASEKNGTNVLSIPIKKSGSIGFGRSSVNGESFEKAIREEIALTSLDSFSKQQKISRVDFIKIDVEGHEMSVLKGAKGLLKKHSPSVMIEINKDHLSNAQTKVADVFLFFQSLGYTYARIDEENGTLISNDGNNFYDTDYLFYKE